jgi:hypothetical protein
MAAVDMDVAKHRVAKPEHFNNIEEIQLLDLLPLPR